MGAMDGNEITKLQPSRPETRRIKEDVGFDKFTSMLPVNNGHTRYSSRKAIGPFWRIT
jgi:hypothetical protein